MAFGDISLTSAMRNNLVSLQQTSSLLARTQERLATGKKVNSALDNPASFFAAKGEMDRASQLDGLKDNMGEAIQAVKAADNGVTAITSLVENLRGVITQARSETAGATTAQMNQFSALMTQIDQLATDSGYKGTNFLATGSSLQVNFNENATSSLTVTGFDASRTGLALTALAVGDTGATLNTAEASLNTALTTLRTQSASLASNLSVIQTRQDFTTAMVNTLQTGANNLTGADTNQEGANMLMLQTRNQLGTTSLSLASQAAQSVLKLF